MEDKLFYPNLNSPSFFFFKENQCHLLHSETLGGDSENKPKMFLGKLNHLKKKKKSLLIKKEKKRRVFFTGLHSLPAHSSLGDRDPDQRHRDKGLAVGNVTLHANVAGQTDLESLSHADGTFSIPAVSAERAF